MIKQLVFARLPQDLAELQALPEVSMTDPFAMAALTVTALCRFEGDRDVCVCSITCAGPGRCWGSTCRTCATVWERRAISRFLSLSARRHPTTIRQQPYTVMISGAEDAATRASDRCQMLIQSGGADSPRPVDLRRKGDGTWWLWDQFLMSDIRVPVKDDPWA